MQKTIDIAQLPEGGMGIKLISQIADDIQYTRTQDNKNCLVISKNYEPTSVNHQSKSQAKNVLGRLSCFRENHQFTPFNSDQVRHRKLKLTVNSELNAVETILDWYGQIQNLPIPRQVLQLGQIALIEAFTNVVRHAHLDLPDSTPVDMELTVSNNCLEMIIWDYGQPFDLEGKLKEL